MRKIVLIALLAAVCTLHAQAYKGKGDAKFNVGMTIQNGGTGIAASVDYGLGENFSAGLLSSYLLNGRDIRNVDFGYRLDVKARVNANLGSIIKLSPKFDLYPGLNLGLKTFGGHLGSRYFFSDGFGVYAEFSAPFSRYDRDAIAKYNNSLSFSIGASFNMN